MSEPTFGVALLRASTTQEAADLEHAAEKRSRFAGVETVIAGLAIRAAQGERVVRIARGDDLDRVEVLGIPGELRSVLDSTFKLEAQQSRGAWFLPETVSVRASSVNLASYFRAFPRYAHTLACEDRGKVALSGDAEAMTLWSALEPLFTAILTPLTLRTEKAGKLDKSEFLAEWDDACAAITAMGLAIDRQMSVLAWGGGWSKLRFEERIELKRNLLEAISQQMELTLVRGYRLHLIRRLTAKYYARAKNGKATRKQVVTKDLAPILAAFFGGDWLEYVAYLGEQPHEDERIVTALPESKLFVAGRSRAAEVAAKKGLPLEEVERMLGAVWQSADGESPIIQRVEALKRWWVEFDAIHARQAVGSTSLWGLVEDGGWSCLDLDLNGPQPGLYRRLLSPQLVAQIDRLWSKTVLDKWADRLVSEPFPHALASKALGPGLAFWNGCALTAWFVCQGPSSRTDIPGLAHYYRRELAELDSLGFGVHPSLFQELKQVQLGPEEPLRSNTSSIDVGHGMSIQLVTSSGSRRSGFEMLRDVITRHRRWWAQRLDEYLRAQWESQLKSVARQFHLMTEEKGKPPTFKQFAKYAVGPARIWFGGDVSLLYTVIGQKCPCDIERRASLQPDGLAFAAALFQELGGRRVDRKAIMEDDRTREVHAKAWELERKVTRLASDGFRYSQMEDALGRPPTPKEFGFNFEWWGDALGATPEAAWEAYSRGISRVRDRFRAQSTR